MIELILFLAGFTGLVFSAILTFKNKTPYFQGICFGTLSCLGAFLLSVVLSVLVYGINPIDVAIAETFDAIKEAVGMITPEQLAEGVTRVDILSMVESLRESYIILFPAIIIITNAMAVLGLFIIIRAVLKLIKKDVSFIPAFGEMRLTKGILIGGIFTIIMVYMLSGTALGNAFSNIQLLFMSYMYLCGMSLIDYWFSKKVKNGVLRFVIYLLLSSVMGVVIYIGSFLAVLDIFKDFRNKAKEI